MNCRKCDAEVTHCHALLEVATGFWLGPFAECPDHPLAVEDRSIASGEYEHHVVSADLWCVIETMQI